MYLEITKKLEVLFYETNYKARKNYKLNTTNFKTDLF